MKKLMAAALILTLISCAALAEGADPIVGCWYVDIEFAEGPAIQGYENYTRAVVLMTFEEDGRITVFEVDYSGEGLVPLNRGVVGQWEKTESGYLTRVLLIGEYEAFLEGDELRAVSLLKDTYYTFRRMTHFGWYTDLQAAK